MLTKALRDLKDPTWTIILPRYDNKGNRIKRSKRASAYKSLLKRFMGFTAFPNVLGCYYEEKRYKSKDSVRKQEKKGNPCFYEPSKEHPDHPYLCYVPVCDMNDVIFVSRDLDEPGDVEYVYDWLMKMSKEGKMEYPPEEPTREAIIKADAEYIEDFLSLLGIFYGQESMYVKQEEGDVEFISGKKKDKLKEDMIEKGEKLKTDPLELLY